MPSGRREPISWLLRGPRKRYVVVGVVAYGTSASLGAEAFGFGTATVVAVAAEERSPLYRDIPTFRENGVDLVIGAFHGVYAPRGLPAEVRQKIVAALEKTMSAKELIGHMSAAGAGVLFRKGEAAHAFLAQQDAIYRQIIDDLGMRVTKK